MVNLLRIVLLCYVSTLVSASAKEIHHLPAPVNTRYNEFAPSLTADGSTMVFNSNRYGSKYQNIFITRKKNGIWTTPQALDILNSKYNDETPFISADGDLIIFASDRDGSMYLPKDKKGRIRVSFDLYWSVRKKGRWERPRKVPGVNTADHERAPALSNDGKYIFFARWPFGELYKTRIMSGRIENGRISKITTLPAKVNSNFAEAAFVPASRGRGGGEGGGFYFSAARADSQGGWDIYFIPFNDGKFGQAERIQGSINSKANDLYLSSSGDFLYFCSNRKGGLGGYDIYAYATIKKYQVTVIDALTKNPLKVEANLKISGKSFKLPSDLNGVIDVKVAEDSQIEQIQIIKPGYMPFLKGRPIFKENNYTAMLERLQKEKSFTLHNIHFDSNSSKLKNKSKPILNELVNYIKANHSLRLMIIGHTDLNGSKEYNLDLSLRRAKAVKNYLVKAGISASRFEIEGAGFSRPLAKKKYPKADALNRRTEFKIIDK